MCKHDSRYSNQRMSNFTQLPDEILLKIFQHFDDSYHAEQLREHLPLVCKRWWKVIYQSQGISRVCSYGVGVLSKLSMPILMI